jgi:Holliday junction resolvase RusA-like endonuclease
MFLEYKFTFLNQYIAAERSNKYKAAKIKRETTFAIKLMLLGKPKIKTPCGLKLTWYVKNKRMDLDNISFAAKYILDAMQKAKLIENDGLNYITKLHHDFKISDKVGVKIERID